MEERIARIERWLTRRMAWRMLLVLAVITLPAILALRHVRLDYDFEKFFPQDDPELDRYLAFRDRFGHDNDFVMIGVPNAPTVFDRSFLVKVDSMAARLQRIPRVRSVATPTRLKDPRITPFGVFEVPWLRLDADSTLAADSARIMGDAFVSERFFNTDATALLVLLQCEPDLSKAKSDTLLAGIERVVNASGLPGVRRAGRIHGQQHYIALMERELVTFFTSSVVLLAIFLFIAFRKPWGVIAPIAVVGLTVLWQVALMTALGHPLSILTMLLPTILFVVGMSDSVHIIERYIEALREGHAKQRALAITYAEVGLSTFITMLTTAIGYATLVTSGIRPMSEFGVFTAAGVFLAYALSFTLLPAVLVLLPTPVPSLRAVRGSSADRAVHGLLRRVLRDRRRIPWFALLVVAACTVFLPRLKVNNFLLEDLPDSDPQKQGFLWFEREFGGVRPFELELDVHSARGIWDLAVLRDVERVQQHVEQRYGVHGIVSPVTLLCGMNKAANGGDGAFARLPDTQDEVDRLVKLARAWAGAGTLALLATPDGAHARLSGRMVDEGGHVHARKNAELEAFLRANTDPARVSFHQTGMAFLIDRNNSFLSWQMLISLGSSFLLIALIMVWVFRSWRVVLVALVPNLVPLVFVAGLMGALGIDLKVSTAIIFSNAFGIAVDDTIHLLAKLRIELARGLSLPYALKRTYLSGGKAVIVMSIMLCAGFVTLIASDFASVFYMGLLISITLAVALVAELFLLPVMVLWFLRPAAGVNNAPRAAGPERAA